MWLCKSLMGFTGALLQQALPSRRHRFAEVDGTRKLARKDPLRHDSKCLLNSSTGNYSVSEIHNLARVQYGCQAPLNQQMHMHLLHQPLHVMLGNVT